VLISTDNNLILFLAEMSICSQFIDFITETKAYYDVKDILEKLKIKAVTKIHAYLLEQVYKFRKPMANYQVPQNTLLKYK
jgi:Vps52 / Sac2 family.